MVLIYILSASFASAVFVTLMLSFHLDSIIANVDRRLQVLEERFTVADYKLERAENKLKFMKYDGNKLTDLV